MSGCKHVSRSVSGFLARIWESMSTFEESDKKKPREARFLNAASAAIFWKLDNSSASENAFSTNLGHKFTRFTASQIASLYLHQCEMLTLRVLSSTPTSILADTATHSNTQQHTTTHSNTPQYTAKTRQNGRKMTSFRGATAKLGACVDNELGGLAPHQCR